MNNCPCGSGVEYDGCCGPFHSKASLPKTAEALMRSRYSAYVKSEIDYLFQTLLPERRSVQDLKAAREWAKSSEWLGLQIVSARGGEHDHQGQVEFIARFKLGGVEQSHHEISTFKKLGDRWFFADGKVLPTMPEGLNVSRNAECPCGSGKKFKRCCGAKAA